MHDGKFFDSNNNQVGSLNDNILSVIDFRALDIAYLSAGGSMIARFNESINEIALRDGASYSFGLSFINGLSPITANSPTAAMVNHNELKGKRFTISGLRDDLGDLYIDSNGYIYANSQVISRLTGFTITLYENALPAC